MNIYAKKGDEVRCKTLFAGCRSEQKTARCFLKVGQKYTIEKIEVLSWRTSVWTQEFPDIAFNSVFFEDAEERISHSFVSTNQEMYSEASPLDYITSRIEFIISTCTDEKVKQGLEQALRVVKTVKQ